MKPKPIYLTDAEARQAVQGKLTEIVRRMNPQPPEGITEYRTSDDGRAIVFYEYEKVLSGTATMKGDWVKLPFTPGSIVPAKETWGIYGIKYYYKADYGMPIYQWRSPITMPLSAVRHWYRIESVRAIQAREMKDFGIWLIQDEYYKWCYDYTWLWVAEISEAEKK